MKESSLVRLREGDVAPDFTLRATDGGQVHLAEHPKPVVLVFLRHLAWLYWAHHLVQLHQSEVLSKLERLDTGLLVISFGNLDQLTAWVPQLSEDFFATPPDSPPGRGDPFRRTRFLTDPVLLAYRAYGLNRHTAGEIFSLKILWQYAQWAVEGKPIRHSDMDVHQRGGNFVVGRNGRLTLAHVPQDPSDRPSVETILAACRRGGS